MSIDEIDEITNIAISQDQRELWRPNRIEQMAAIETLLASSIPSELRSALREREQEISRKEPR